MPDVEGTSRASTTGSWWSRVLRYLGNHLVGAVVAVVVAGVLGAAFAIVQGDSSEPTSQEPDGKNCPSDFPVKGNVTRDGERTYHVPGSRQYQITIPDQCFDSEASAEKAGYRASTGR